MRDLTPDDWDRLERIRHAFYETCRLFGFRIMEPSPIESLAALEVKSGPGIRNEIYFFRDKSGRDVGLRFDLTVGLTRYVTASRGLQLPAKLASFGPMWRYDEPQFGRYRWFYQWDAEVFGPKTLEADAEVIEFTAVLLKILGLKQISIEVGDRRIVEEYIRKRLGVSDLETVLGLLRAVDKAAKKPPEEIVAAYEGKGVSRERLNLLLQLAKIQGMAEHVLDELKPYDLTSVESITQLSDMLGGREVSGVSFSLGIVRGLDYYTGVVFEAFDLSQPKLGALAGGGRYDILPALFDRPEMGATGVAGGVERTMLALAKAGPEPKKLPQLVFVAYASERLRNAANKVAAHLRKAGIAAESELLRRPLRRQMELAAAREAGCVVIVGPVEFAQGRLVLKNMRTGVERVVKKSDVVQEVSTLLAHPE